MPSTKRRINLTVPDNIYDKLQTYKYENGLENDATACLQLIVQQLNNFENNKTMMQLLREIPLDALLKSAERGFDLIHSQPEKLLEE